MKLKTLTSEKIFRSVEDFMGFRPKSKETTVVFTNGCFDILHAGHVDYLEKCARKGDFLVVGLNSDESVTRLKGPERPINDWKKRAIVLAALACIDAVIVFEEDTPLILVETISPQVLIKGGDYVVEDIVGYKHVISYAGTVEVIDFVYHTSTSETLEKIMKL